MAFNAINHADQPCDCLAGVMKSTEDDGIARDSEAKKDFPVTTNSGYASFIDESRERIDEIDVQLIELIKSGRKFPAAFSSTGWNPAEINPTHPARMTFWGFIARVWVTKGARLWR
ncbi:hypothetical protein [Streptomyces viridosporus]|uniref:hypothetical protein n=1 Tax=Streptomyces viridosporus TaxID=67581 RepID=UPI0036F9660D